MGALTQANPGPARLRELLAGGGPVVAPGAYDALSARLVEQAGFDCVYLTGFGASASLLGRPDVGLLSFAEMGDQARRLVQAVAVPVIADADTGYGNPITVQRTVREYAAAGVAALHLEDQLAPKRCGHLTGKQVIPAGEMVEKLRAAVEARPADGPLIIARTDARAPEGLDAALDRARRYREAGADMLFVEAPQSPEEVAAIAAALPGTPLLYNGAEGGRSPVMELDRLQELGFALVLLPIGTLLAATRAVQEELARVRAHVRPAAEGALAFDAFTDLIGLPEIQALEQRYAG